MDCQQEIPFNATDLEKDKVAQMEEVIGSKEERRKRKKKLEVSTLFRYYKKRPSGDNLKTVSLDDPEINSSHLEGGTAAVEMLQAQLLPEKKKDKVLNKEKGAVC
jgi:hypothetical protein